MWGGGLLLIFLRVWRSRVNGILPTHGDGAHVEHLWCPVYLVSDVSLGYMKRRPQSSE